MIRHRLIPIVFGLLLCASGAAVAQGVWEPQNPLPPVGMVYGVWGTSASDVFEVGYGATTGLSWTPVSSTDWLTVTDADPGTGEGTETYSVAANTGPERTAGFSVAGPGLMVGPLAECAYAIDPASASFPPEGGSGSVDVTAGDTCSWTAVSSDPWLTVTSGSGSGVGTVEYSVATNIGPERTATLTIGDETLTLTQASGCEYTLETKAAGFGMHGGSGSVWVYTSSGNCAWTAESNAAWITITYGQTGTGTGEVIYSVDSYSGTSRSGTLTIGGQTFQITQFGGVWEEHSPLPHGGALRGVWGTSGSDVFAVGDKGTILHYDGTTWSPMVSGTTANLLGVWGSSASDVFAVGQLGTILHYNGAGWSPMTGGTYADLYGVWGRSSSQVFAVGSAGTILRYNGTSWSPMTSGTAQWLYGVWGSSENNVFAVGEAGTILRYDGTGWSPMTSGTTRRLAGVWGRSGNDVFAVGGYSGIILHYDGTGWSTMASDMAAFLHSVSGNPGSAVFAVGGTGGTILRYEGSAWSPMTSGVDVYLYGVWGASGSDVFAVGDGGAILHYDGANWSSMTIGPTTQLLGVWEASESDVFAVGAYGNILHYDGTTWSPMTSGATNHLYDVWGSSGSNVFAVGNGAMILRYNGTSWSPMTSAWCAYLHAVWGASGTDVFAVGSAGVIRHYNGTSWSSMGSPTTKALYGVWGNSGTDVFVVGDGGTILHYSGTNWSPMTSGTSGWLLGVWGSSGSDVFAVGQNGTVLHYDGTSWSPMTSGVDFNLDNVWGSSGSDVFAVGEGGTILHYDGTAWSPMQSNSSTSLFDVSGSSGADVFAVGNYGTILHYTVPDCSALIQPATAGFGAEGGSDSFQVTAETGCSWTPSSSADWLTITSSGPYSGNMTVTYTVDPNDGPDRTASISVAGLRFMVGQLAPNEANLSVAKFHSGNPVTGMQAVYSLVVTNSGPHATNRPITVTDVLPTGLTFAGATGTGWACGAVGQAVTCARDDPLAAGASSTVTLTADVLYPAYPAVTNTASVAYAGDESAGNNSASDPTTVTIGNFTLGGYLGVGTDAPQRAVHLAGSNAVFRMDRTMDTASFLLVRTDASGNPLKSFVVGANASGANQGEFIINDMGSAVGGAGQRRMTIANTGDVTFGGSLTGLSFTPSSALRLKTNIRPLENPLATVRALSGVRFDWKATGRPGLGVIGEEVARALPEVVWRAAGTGLLQGVNYDSLVALLVESWKAQLGQIEELRLKREQLRGLLERLQQRNDQLESRSK